MDDLKLLKATELSGQIKNVKANLAHWQHANKFHRIMVFGEDGNRVVEVATDCVDMDVVKTLVVARIQKILASLEYEYSIL